MVRKETAKNSPTARGIKQPPTKKPPVKKAVLTQPNTYIKVDHPVSGEIIAAHHYAVRISTDALGSVEISLDGKTWHPCRQAVGFWWYDWHRIPSGFHKLQVRVIDAAGFIANKSKIIKCECR